MRSSAWPSAGIASLAPLLALLGLWRFPPEAAPSPWHIAAAVALALVVAGGLVTTKRASWGHSLATAGVVGFLVAFLEATPSSPALTLTVIVVAIAVVGSIWGLGSSDDVRLSRRQVRELTEGRARIASALFLVDWALVVVLEVGGGLPARMSLGAGLLLALGFTLVWTLRARRRGNSRWKWPVAAAPTALVAAALAPALAATWAGFVPLALLVSTQRRREVGLFDWWWRPVAERPARLLVVTFAALSVAGSLLLVLPASAASGRSIGLLDAAFTAVSAVCVTGLIVVDTPGAFGGFGEATILVLIQLGGLGIMSFSVVTLSFLGFRPSIRHEAAVAGIFGAEHRGQVVGALGRLLRFTFVAEAMGAVVLSYTFLRSGRPAGEAVWHGLFTAVSAFCNAGFALRSDSLVSYQHDPWVLHVVGALIIIGGLSPATVMAVPALARRHRVSLEAKLALSATALLLVGGALAFLALEWDNTLGELPSWDRVHNAWFQSVTTRTAGFNSVDVAAVRPATLTLIIALMFLGGSPGGTAGGVKTTTGVVLLLAVGSAIRGRWTASAFGRRLSHRTVYKAASIVTVGTLALLIGLFALQLTQEMDGRTALFETASALGTVGLSIGGTAALDEVGKLVIMICMFAGRVGPLSLFLFLGARSSSDRWELVEEDVSVG